jgi:hypothetical protein
MTTFYSILSAMIAVVLFAPLAVADPGTTWDKKIDNPGRFKVLSEFNREAVLDRETGRVWEQSPVFTETNWVDALNQCYTRNVGDREGWRLPTIEELASLVDPNNPAGVPLLPPGHPFNNVLASSYWSATADAGNIGNAWSVRLTGSGGKLRSPKFINQLVWCVRGGQGIDGL